MNHELLDRLKRSQLPTLPVIAVQVLELARRDDASMAEIAQVIGSDPALAAKVLKTVNSSFYGVAKQVGTINHALVIMGLQSIKALALGFSLAGSLNAQKSPTFDYAQFWRQSLHSAVAARTLAKELKCGQHEEAFLAGLLSDIGTLVMHRVLGEEYDALLRACQGDQVELVELSREKFDLDHAQVGGMLAEHWGLPPVLAEPIRLHHSLDQRQHRTPLAEAVYGGVLCGQVFAAGMPGLLERANDELRTRFNLDVEQIDHVFHEIGARTGELAKLFEVNIGVTRTYQEIQDEAKQVLIELTLQMQFQSQQVLAQNQQLQARANSDGLTGLANRSRFDEFLKHAFAESCRTGQPLGLLFLDVDKFKFVNDTYGHQGGDAVLAHLGRVLRPLARPMDLAARYGGEELVLALPGANIQVALAVAETLRQAIADAVIRFQGRTIPITASVGVAVREDGMVLTAPAQLVAAADKAVYAAKQAGRNCVRFCEPHVVDERDLADSAETILRAAVR